MVTIMSLWLPIVLSAVLVFVASAVIWMVLPKYLDKQTDNILKLLKELKVPVILVINQVDRYPKPHILPVIAQMSTLYDFREIIPISAKTGDQVDLLLEKTYDTLPEGPPHFDSDQISDQKERTLVEEIIREKLFQLTEQEIPYATAVMVESFKEREDGIIEIEATVVVEKESQKAIVIGKKGQMMKTVGQLARRDIEALIGKRVYLKLWAKVMHDWKRDGDALRKLGYGDE